VSQQVSVLQLTPQTSLESGAGEPATKGSLASTHQPYQQQQQVMPRSTDGLNPYYLLIITIDYSKNFTTV